MKYDRSLQEVWKWKDRVYEKTKGLTIDEAVDEIRKGAEELCKRYDIHLRKVGMPHSGYKKGV